MGLHISTKDLAMHLRDEGGFIFSDVTGATYEVSWLYGTYALREYESGTLCEFGVFDDTLLDHIGSTYGWHAYTSVKEHFSRKYWGLDFATTMRQETRHAND